MTSAGPDGQFSSKARFSSDDFSVSKSEIDYFAETLSKIDSALNKTFKETQTFPENLDQLTKSLRDSGISWSELRDAWGHPYYATFRQAAMHADKISVETYEGHTANAIQHVEMVPVTRQINYAYLCSAGEDSIEGTADDFYVGSFSRASLDRNGQDRSSFPIANPQVFSGSTGAVSGIVTDITGGVIPGATITASNISIGYSFEAKADEAGNYVLRNLPAGSYAVHFISKGFRQTVITNVPVQSSNVTKLDAILNVGETNQTVTVTESVPLVETTSAALSAIVPRTKAGVVPPQVMTPRLRQYFPETLFWQPELVTDSRGHARLKFPLADNITTWKLSAIASTESGEIGTVEKEIRAFQPFFVEHDPPKFLTVGDEIDLPVVLRNFLDRSLSMTAEMKPESWFTALGPTSLKASIPARDDKSEVFKFRAISPIKEGKQRITVGGADSGDAVERTLSVRPDGEERVETTSQIFGSSASLDIQVPDETIPGSLQGTLKFYPNLNAHVLESIQGILGRPYGCAEQTISSAYPSLLLLRYAKDTPGAPAAELAHAKRYLQLGHDRLAAYQAFRGGITYWGRGEPDLALTAYGLKFLSDAREFIGTDDFMGQENLS